MSGTSRNALAPEPPPPPSLPGFEDVAKYWDKGQGLYAAKILPGEYYVTRHPSEMIVTVLGSCVSACIRDSRLRIGGMNHFMLPMTKHTERETLSGNAERYGSFAMEALINQILSRGGQRKNLEVKVTGGGRILSIHSDIGDQNIEFIRHFLAEEKLELKAEDLGDVFARKVYYQPATGLLRVKKLRNVTNDTISVRETAYAETLSRKSLVSEVDLF